MEQDILLMKHCLGLAKKGLGDTYPNPLVGCVIFKEGKIIGEGWHKKAGLPHAEVEAINSVKDKSEIQGATLVVNLEPCCHYGRTPPCTDLIIKSGIKKVVIGMLDPNPKVNGKGKKILESNQIVVKHNVCHQEALDINKRFINAITKKRPYIFLKWAESADGFMDIDRNHFNEKKSVAISSEISRLLVHKWRSEEQAIMIGTNTAINDNPKLTVRGWSGTNPIRVVIDRTLRIPQSSYIFNSNATTIVLTERELSGSDPKVIYKTIDFKNEIITQITSTLYNMNIQSLIVEGGQQLLNTFIASDIWDEAFIFKSNNFLNIGLRAPVLNVKPKTTKIIDSDILQHYKKEQEVN